MLEVRNIFNIVSDFKSDVEDGYNWAAEKVWNIVKPAAAGVLIGAASTLAPSSTQSIEGTNLTLSPLLIGFAGAALVKAGLSVRSIISRDSDYPENRIPILTPLALSAATVIVATILTRNPVALGLVALAAAPYFYAKTAGQLTGMVRAAIKRPPEQYNH